MRNTKYDSKAVTKAIRVETLKESSCAFFVVLFDLRRTFDLQEATYQVTVSLQRQGITFGIPNMIMEISKNLDQLIRFIVGSRLPIRNLKKDIYVFFSDNFRKITKERMTK